MTNIYFATRDAARAMKIGRYVDHGTTAPKGKRHACAIPLAGNARQRRKSLRAMLRQVS